MKTLIVAELFVGFAAMVLYRLWYSIRPEPAVFLAGYKGGWQARDVMASVVSLMILCTALYVILSGSYPEETQKWATGIVGLVTGFWLKPGK